MEVRPALGFGRHRAHVLVGMDVSPSRFAAPASNLRSSSTYIRTGRGTSQPEPATFRETLRRADPGMYTVRAGDTLSEIVHEHLRSRGIKVDSQGLYERVRAVATANGIADPDVITPGQRIALDGLDAAGSPERVGDSLSHSAPPLVPAPPRSSTLMLRSIDDLVPGNTRISSEFGLREDPFHGEERHHQGVDIAARRGSPIYPVDAGVVVFAGWHGGHGKTVIVRHGDGVETVYAHADSLLVEKGEHVKPSDKLGLVGSTGRSTGPHLHFEVRRAGVPVDPLAALGAD